MADERETTEAMMARVAAEFRRRATLAGHDRRRAEKLGQYAEAAAQGIMPIDLSDSDLMGFNVEQIRASRAGIGVDAADLDRELSRPAASRRSPTPTASPTSSPSDAAARWAQAQAEADEAREMERALEAMTPAELAALERELNDDPELAAAFGS